MKMLVYLLVAVSASLLNCNGQTINALTANGINSFSRSECYNRAELNRSAHSSVNQAKNGCEADLRNNRALILGEDIMSINQSGYESELSVYPNPANEYLYIRMGNSTGRATVSLYTITGRQVMEKEKEIQGTVAIRINNIAKGIYILKVKTTQGNILIEKVEIAL